MRRGDQLVTVTDDNTGQQVTCHRSEVGEAIAGWFDPPAHLASEVEDALTTVQDFLNRGVYVDGILTYLGLTITPAEAVSGHPTWGPRPGGGDAA